MNLTKANMDALQIEESSYPAQFVEAMNVNGGDLQGATVIDYIMHFLTFFWKVSLQITDFEFKLIGTYCGVLCNC